MSQDRETFDREIGEARRYERGLLTKAAVGLLLIAVVALLHEIALRIGY